jgi:cysteine-rich repeat protein
MAAISSAPSPASAVTTFSGIASDLPLASLSGWSVCYQDNYIDSGAPIASILSDCNGDYLMLACRPVGDPDLTLAAYAPRADVTVSSLDNTPHDANGVGWYFSDELSWGFAPQGSPIERSSCDYLDSDSYPGAGGVSDGDQRLCFHTGGGAIAGGWRCGRTDFLQGTNTHERVILHAFAACGNGLTEGGEQCDDGNLVAGDCCDATCQFEAAATACDDGDACTEGDVCDGAGACAGPSPADCDDGNPCSTDSCVSPTGCVNDDAPIGGCLAPGKSVLLVKNSADDTKDKLLWKWMKGAAIDPVDIADPLVATDYALCLYAGTTNAALGGASIPAGAGWSAIGAKGFKFKGSSPNGVSLALLKGGAAGKSKALAKGKGAALPDPMLPLAYPVTVQLRKDGSPLCLESVFVVADEKKNTATQFKAKQ